MEFDKLKEWMELTDQEIDAVVKANDNLFEIVKLMGQRIDLQRSAIEILSKRIDLLEGKEANKE